MTQTSASGALPPPPPPPPPAGGSTRPSGPSPSGPPPSGPGSSPPPSGAAARGPLGAAAVPSHWVRDTPARMRVVSAALVVVGLVVGLIAAQSFLAVDAALQRAGENAAQLVRLQDVETLLVRADADATNAFLVGGLEPVEQRQDYDDAVRLAAEQVAYAARAQPADGEALAALNTEIQNYVATIQSARANNRQAFPVGAQYLRVAGAGLRADALPLLSALRAANEDRAEAEFAAARRAWVAAVVVSVLGLGAIALALRWLARRTHRYVNVPVAGAGVIVLLVLVAAAVVLGSVASTVGDVRRGSYAVERALSDARVAAFDAKANESLTLISRGSGAAFEESWAASAVTTETLLGDAVDLGGAGGELQDAWAAYAEEHRAIRALDDGGEWDQAVAAATSREPGSANAAFQSFAQVSQERLDTASLRTASALTGAGVGLELGAWLALLAGLLAAALGWWGMWQRIEEYR